MSDAFNHSGQVIEGIFMSGDKLNRQLPVTVDCAKAKQLHMPTLLYG
ncbi:MAG: hypothetical protein O7G83_18210 [Proteobacteria bacterium]|nr:hypothetical protein [Pseudomonadota bacterium]